MEVLGFVFFLGGSKILMSGMFLGVKFQAHVYFWVHNMKLCRTPPPVMYIASPPPAPLG